MSEKLLVKDGLRIGKKELSILQDKVYTNLDRLMAFVAPVPPTGAVLTTKATSGLLGTALKVTSPGDVVTVGAGSGISADYSFLSVAAPTTNITGSFPNSTTRKVVIHWAPTSVESGTVSITGTINLAFSVDVSALYGAGDYIRLAGSSAGNNGTYRLLSVSGSSAVLADPAGGTNESGLTHSQAGKFFPGYPASGTTDIVQHDSYTITLELSSYTVLPNSIYLADVTKDSGGSVTVVDQRVAVVPLLAALQITDANVADNAAIAESKIALTTEMTEAKTWRHQQNTDAFTTAPEFHVNGSGGPRVLTTDDFPSGTGPLTTGAGLLTQEVNYQIEFYNTAPSPSVIPGATLFKAPSFKASWGIIGTGTFAAGVFSLTSAHDCGESLAGNRLVNHILVDSAGQTYKITASDAVSPTTAFTVTVTVGGSQPNPVNGAVTIHNNARSYRIKSQPVGQAESLAQIYLVPLQVNGQVGTSANPQITGVAGDQYDISLISNNTNVSGTTEFTLTQTVTWGSVTTATINVPSASITVSPTASKVGFQWPAPVGFDPTTMDYSVAYSNDANVAPSFFNKVAEELTGGAGRIYIPAEYPQVAWVYVGVRDMSGTMLSSSYGSAVGQPTYTATTPTQTLSYAFTFVNGDFAANYAGDGTNTVYVAQQLFVRYVNLVGISFIIGSLTATGSPQFKARVWPNGNPTGGDSSDILTSVGAVTTPVNFTPEGDHLFVALEKISGTVTGSMTGIVTVHYVETGTRGGGVPAVIPF